MNFIRFIICTLALFNAANLFGKTPDITLTEKNVIAIKGEITHTSVSKVEFTLMNMPSNDIFVYIDSPGGSVFAGAELITIMRGSGKKFTCIANTAVSMAFVIFQACDVRLVTGSAIVMQHEASFGLQGQAPNNVTYFNFLMRALKKMDQQQADKIGLTYKAFKAKTRNDWWMYGEDAVTNKVADDIVNVRCDKVLSAKKATEKFNFFFMSVELTFSACPVISAPLEVKINGATFMEDQTIENQKVKAFIDALNFREGLLKYKATGQGFKPILKP